VCPVVLACTIRKHEPGITSFIACGLLAETIQKFQQ
jgi:hypothetical protein